MKLDGRVALVTGGGSGIGRATAQLLASEGMRVCVVDIDERAAATVADSVGGLGLGCDVSDPEQLDAAFASFVREFGCLDVAFLNAGVSIRWSGDIASLDLADYRRSLGVNLDGVVFGARAAVRTMRRCAGNGKRAIVATASLAGVLPWHPDAVYSLGKHAVVGFMRAIAPNLSPEGIAVHTVCPGITETGVLGNRRPLVEGAGVPVMEPQAIADAVLTAVTAPLDATGSTWIVQHGKPAWPLQFPDVPGPHNRLNVPVRSI
ncbi:SDR family NAD(P)-dependent oxidoreductase [Mycobacterium sp. CVI_P3]|uniref:SDR family NAD(P)-dependent oxidoreductase n=1 Tax=Mycobacterium pinniadriaticum TaxID=2994102 RepID=A0ABT3SGF1_9MYCO|nr:SDR family NAD(P)-dependent oxidoreductase [Mycobacterium pinniadriaticum]MCX2932171.1 SDR family NAD(P)-dependent oxidoreductase [Mycobacterium pinniadriaticum]MCX2938595.1 SDR family NAD(P)-dependent oxidoreductase [Mycobacterium pinniadriaticum]